MLGLHGLCHHTHIMLAVGKHVVLSTLVVQQRQGKEKQATVTARSRQGQNRDRSARAPGGRRSLARAASTLAYLEHPAKGLCVAQMGAGSS